MHPIIVRDMYAAILVQVYIGESVPVSHLSRRPHVRKWCQILIYGDTGYEQQDSSIYKNQHTHKSTKP